MNCVKKISSQVSGKVTIQLVTQANNRPDFLYLMRYAKNKTK
jgi:hypothetical protein